MTAPKDYISTRRFLYDVWQEAVEKEDIEIFIEALKTVAQSITPETPESIIRLLGESPEYHNFETWYGDLDLGSSEVQVLSAADLKDMLQLAWNHEPKPLSGQGKEEEVI